MGEVMALETLSYYRKVAQFAGVRLGNYVELGLLEVALYKTALVRSIVAFVVMAVCGLFALAFLSIAALVTAWGTDYRIQAAWWIFGVWCALAIIAFIIAKSSAPDDAPVSTLGEQIKKDLAAIRGEIDE